MKRRLGVGRAGFRGLGGVLVILTLALASVPLALNASSSPGPVTLVLSSVPPKLPADGQSYGALVVSLENSSGLPVVAPYNITVYLSSSLPSVGAVPSSVTIGIGKSYAVANVTTSASQGTTVVTGSATGLRTGAVSVRTVIPSGYPDHLAVFAVPAVQLARTSSHGEVVVQIQDDLGIPARSSAAVAVSVTSSDNGTVRVSGPTLTIPAQQNVAWMNYTAGLVTGTASLTASASGYISGTAAVRVVQAPPLVLKVTAEPDVIANGSTGRLVVSLVDKAGNPAEAPDNLQVFLTSSNLTVAEVSGTLGLAPVQVTILKNHVYTTITYSSLSVGDTTFTASAHGLVAGFAQVKVMGASPATELRLFIAPNPVPSTGEPFPAIAVGLAGGQLTTTTVTTSTVTSTSVSSSTTITSTSTTTGTVTTTETGVFPSIASTAIPVVVTASDNTTGKVLERVYVSFNVSASYAVVKFNSTLLPSAAVITAAAQNLTTAQSTVRTLRPDLPIGPPPTSVVVTPVSPTLPADGNSYQGLLVSLKDSTGGPAVAPVDIKVQLSLNRSGIIQLASGNGSVTITSDQSYAIVPVKTLLSQGTVNVTAASPGYSSSWTLLSTVALSPARIAMYVSPSPAMLSSTGQAALLAVQLQGSDGTPSRARQPTPITITSSNRSVLADPLTVNIPARSDYAVVLLVPSVPSKAVLTAISPGLIPANATLISYSLPVRVSLSTSQTAIMRNGTATLTDSVLFLGKPLPNASISWYATGGTLSATQSLTGPNGAASVRFTPDAVGIGSVTAVIDDLVIGKFNSTTQIVVYATPTKSSPSLVSQILSYIYYIVAAAAAAVVAVVFLWRRRRGRVTEEEDEFGMEAGPESAAFDFRGSR